MIFMEGYAVPLHNRPAGNKRLKSYFRQFIHSADRARLNITLLDWAERQSNIKLLFGHGLAKLDLDKKYADFEHRYFPFLPPTVLQCLYFALKLTVVLQRHE